MEEFTQEVKNSICEEIESLKKMLDKLYSEVKDIETGDPLEFIAPIMQINKIDTEVHGIRATLQEWQAERTECSESP